MRRALEAQAAAAQAARLVLDRAAVRRDAAWRDAAAANVRRVRTVLYAPFAIGVALVALGIAAPVLFAVGGVALIGWAVVAVLAWRAAATGSYLKIDGVSPDDAVDKGVVPPLKGERYEDVAESLCAAFGLPLPELLVLVDAAPNSIAAGGKDSPATIVFTSGLLASLDRIELEAVLAHELSHVKRLDTLSGGLSAALLHGGRAPLPGARRLAGWLEGPDRELDADLAAMSVTRYPPALASSLDKVSSAPSSRPQAVTAGVVGDTGAQWLDPFAGPASREVPDEGAGTFDVLARLDLLREL